MSYGFVIEPEWHPGDHDDHEGRDVDGDDVIGQLTLERHVDRQTTVIAWKKRNIPHIICIFMNFSLLITLTASKT